MTSPARMRMKPRVVGSVGLKKNRPTAPRKVVWRWSVTGSSLEVDPMAPRKSASHSSGLHPGAAAVVVGTLRVPSDNYGTRSVPTTLGPAVRLLHRPLAPGVAGHVIDEVLLEPAVL